MEINNKLGSIEKEKLDTKINDIEINEQLNELRKSILKSKLPYSSKLHIDRKLKEIDDIIFIHYQHYLNYIDNKKDKVGNV